MASLGASGLFWKVLASSGRFWKVLSGSGRFWHSQYEGFLKQRVSPRARPAAQGAEGALPFERAPKAPLPPPLGWGIRIKHGTIKHGAETMSIRLKHGESQIGSAV